MRRWTVADVMTEAVVSVRGDASYRTLVKLMVAHRCGALPVVDGSHQVVGVVSEIDLLRKIEFAGSAPGLFEGLRRRSEREKASAGAARELMSSPAVTVHRATSITGAARLMDDIAVKHLPVVDDLGRLIGILSRIDLLKVHLRPDDEIEAELAELMPPGAAVTVDEGVVTLSGRVVRWSTAQLTARAASEVAGVVEVTDRLDFEHDDSPTPIGVFGVG